MKLYEIWCHDRDCWKTIHEPHKPEIIEHVLGIEKAISRARELVKQNLNVAYINWKKKDELWYCILHDGKVKIYNRNNCDYKDYEKN